MGNLIQKIKTKITINYNYYRSLKFRRLSSFSYFFYGSKYKNTQHTKNTQHDKSINTDLNYIEELKNIQLNVKQIKTLFEKHKESFNKDIKPNIHLEKENEIIEIIHKLKDKEEKFNKSEKKLYEREMLLLIEFENYKKDLNKQITNLNNNFIDLSEKFNILKNETNENWHFLNFNEVENECI